MFFCCSCLIAPLCVRLWDVCGEGVLSVLSSPETGRKIKGAGGVLGLNGSASPVCGTEQGSRFSSRDGLFQKPSL